MGNVNKERRDLREVSDLFGDSWGLKGNIDKTKIRARIGEITEDSGFRIGLTAKQLDNLGSEYGQTFASLQGAGGIPVNVYNVFGKNKFEGTDSVYVSRGLAEKMKLEFGGRLEIHRILDKEGRIKYDCENQVGNPFGMTWDKIEQPVEGIIAAIDDRNHYSGFFKIGLSAAQLRNLGIERGSDNLDSQALAKSLEANKGELDSKNYGTLRIEFEGRKKSPKIYNALGMKSVGGCGVRVSFNLADVLGLKLGDKVRLYTE